jgi:hypothetical protein
MPMSAPAFIIRIQHILYIAGEDFPRLSLEAGRETEEC